MHIERDPVTMWVNRRGRRFIDEAAGNSPFESVNAVLRQPGKVCYTLFDDKIRQEFEEGNGTVNDVPGRGTAVKGRAGLKERIEVEVDKGRAKISDSLDDIATWIGASPEVLLETVDQYNRFCEQGRDPIFSKDRKYMLPLKVSPYYAIKGMTAYLDTLGGIRVDEAMEVLDPQDNPIPGLYAAGVIVSGWQGETYCGFLSGSAFAFAIGSGRLAGENAATFIESSGS
jgi:fumarate reductase flavoprotein subunit